MTRALILMSVLGLALTGCSLGKPKAPDPLAAYAKPADTRDLIDTIQTLKIEPIRGGVIVRATGLAPVQGYSDAGLVLLPADGSGHLVFEFRVAPPKGTAPQGTPASRQITAAASLTDFALTGVSVIEVHSAQNTLSAHR